MHKPRRPVRVLVVPGLHDSGAAHWQSWLQAAFRRSARALQDDWSRPDLAAWSARIEATVADDADAVWIAVAHSFGCLAVADCLARQALAGRAGEGEGAGPRIVGALLVAPAEPRRFGIEAALPLSRLGVPATMITSSDDPWMSVDSAARWARRWGCGRVDLGAVGHINTESGFGPLPKAKALTQALIRRAETSGCVERSDRAAQPMP